MENCAFGEKCKYLQFAGEDCKNYNGANVKLKGILFDVNDFWMIVSHGNCITRVETCRWLQRGSKDVLKDFLRPPYDPWLVCTNAICDDMHVKIMDCSVSVNETAWLGTGANGRVFKLTNGQILKIVVGNKSDDVETEYNSMMQLLNDQRTSSLVFPLVEHSYCRGEVGTVKYAGYRMLTEGRKIEFPVTKQLKMKLASSLYQLHKQNVIHGDPRIQNALLLDDAVKWIDFRTSSMVTAMISRRRDVEILIKSLKCTEDSRTNEEIRKYAESPTEPSLSAIVCENW